MLLRKRLLRQYFLTSSSFLFFGYGGTLGVIDVTGATGIDGVFHYFRDLFNFLCWNISFVVKFN